VIREHQQDGRVVWVTRSFLDYRVPVYAALDELLGGRLVVVYNGDYVPGRVQAKAHAALGERAVALHGERRLGPNAFGARMANRAVRIPWQPGLLRAILEHRPVMLLSDGFFQWTVACLWLRAKKRIPHVMCYERTAHTERHAQWYRREYRRRAITFIDAVCCSGSLCGEYTRSLGVPGAAITYGHMVADTEGIRLRMGDVERSVLRKQHGLDGVVFLYVGRLVPGKGVMEMLRAWQGLAGHEPAGGRTLALVGDGPERAAAAAYCRDHSLRSVRFLGAVDYDDMAPFYAAADCLVMPTLEDNWSLVVPEAMAAGLPVLCSVYNGCWPELIREKVNGWTFDPLSHDDSVRALQRVVNSRDGLPAMGRASRTILSEHTPRRAAHALLRACDIAAEQQGAPLPYATGRDVCDG